MKTRRLKHITISVMCLVSALCFGAGGCGAGYGDVCGADAGGLHGETECYEGRCMHDNEQGVSICKDDGLPEGAVCEPGLCGSALVTDIYCQLESPMDKYGVCAKGIKAYERCHQGTTCARGLTCIKELCRPRQPVGGPCWISQDIQHCQDGLVCGLPDGLTLPLDDKERARYDFTDGRCRVGGKEGEACDETMGIGCDEGFYCKDDINICVKSKP